MMAEVAACQMPSGAKQKKLGLVGSANGNRTRILALKGLRANRCTIAPLPMRPRPYKNTGNGAREQARQKAALAKCGRFHGGEFSRAEISITTRVAPRGKDWSPLAVQEFFVPGHLDGFELGFVGGRGIAGKTREFGDPLVHVGEADGEWVGVREFVGEADSDVFKIVPTKCRRHFHSRRRFNTEGTEIAEKDTG